MKARPICTSPSAAPPAVRLNGRLVKLEVRPLTPEDTETLARAITSEANLQRVNEDGSVDFGFSFRGENRFRVSVYRQKGHLGMALRLVPKQMLSLEEIGMPPAVRELLESAARPDPRHRPDRLGQDRPRWPRCST